MTKLCTVQGRFLVFFFFFFCIALMLWRVNLASSPSFTSVTPTTIFIFLFLFFLCVLLALFSCCTWFDTIQIKITKTNWTLKICDMRPCLLLSYCHYHDYTSLTFIHLQTCNVAILMSTEGKKTFLFTKSYLFLHNLLK